jgi:predicted O-methyltransferase YrrM
VAANQYVHWEVGGTVFPESTFTKPTAFCRRTHLWSAPDEMSSECEVSEFLYALVRLLKPTVVLETGCFIGATSVAIGRALDSNNYGRLVTCDSDAELVAQVKKLVLQLRLPIQVLHARSTDVIKRIQSVDLAFIDSGEDRAAEVTALVPKMAPFGIIALHDTAPHQWQVDNKYFESRGLQCLYMNTPRGLTLFQRRSRAGKGQ